MKSRKHQREFAQGENNDFTLTRALRGLQNHYEYMAQQYFKHANDLKYARPKK